MRASRASEEALQIFRDLAQKNPEAYLPDVATTLSNLGVLNRDQKQMEEARDELDETLQIRRELVQKNPEAYLPDVAETLNSIGCFVASKTVRKRPSRPMSRRCRFTKSLQSRIHNDSRRMSRG